MTTVVIQSQFLGRGSDELGEKLMGSFLRKLWALPDKPDMMLFYNSGVMLLAEGSPVLDALDGLAEAGVNLVACGTCVTFFGLKHTIAVGRIGDMHEMVTTSMTSDRVITP